MHLSATPRSVAPPAPIMPRDVNVLLEQARTLCRAAGDGTLRPLLKGKILGLLCAADDSLEAILFRRAATELGARVSHILPSLTEASPEQEELHTGRLLGRLYDAVECQGVPGPLVARLGDAAGIPIYAGLASATHPTAALAERLDPGVGPMESRRFLVQAMLLHTIG